MLVRLYAKVNVTDDEALTVVQVYAKTIFGKRTTLACYPDETVQDLKNRIQDIEGVPAHLQRLVFAGKQLHEGFELSACGLRNGCTVQLVLLM
jgi:hypothetical protein